MPTEYAVIILAVAALITGGLYLMTRRRRKKKSAPPVRPAAPTNQTAGVAATGARAFLGCPPRAASIRSGVAARGTRFAARLGSGSRLGRSRRSARAVSGAHTDRSVVESARGTFLGCDLRGVSPAPGCGPASEHRRLGRRAGRAP